MLPMLRFARSRSRPRLSRAALACASLLALAGPARAEAQAGAPEAGAAGLRAQSTNDDAVARALELRKSGRDEEALALLEDEQRRAPDARVLAQVAMAEQALGRWTRSYQHLKEALAASGHPWIEQHRKLLEDELRRLEGNVGWLEVRVNVAGARLQLDGEQVGTSPLQKPLLAPVGTVSVIASAPGRHPITRQVTVGAGALSRVEFQLPALEPTPVAQASTDPAQAAEPARRRNPAWLYASGAGAAVALASIGPWMRAEHELDKMSADCGDGNSCSDTHYADGKQHVERLDMATNVLLFGGLAVAAGSLVTYFLWPSAGERKVTTSGWLSPQGAGVLAGGSF